MHPSLDRPDRAFQSYRDLFIGQFPIVEKFEGETMFRRQLKEYQRDFFAKLIRSTFRGVIVVGRITAWGQLVELGAP